MASITRRRFIQITAAAGLAAAFAPVAARAGGGLYRWRGIALGADASMQVYLPEPGRAQALVRRCLHEITRLERIFSLFDPRSALSRLNRDGCLDAPPPELAEVLRCAHHVSDISSGAFDVTVQPLWRLYASHFAQKGAAQEGPPRTEVEAARAQVDYRRLHIAPERIGMAPGMQVTLGGVAQGYITDRVTALLREEGITHTLVEMGESYGLGGHPDGRPWQVGIRDPENAAALAAWVPLANRALATSGGYGTRFNASGTLHHLLDPETGGSANHYASVSVLAPEAVIADALSTALSVLTPEKAPALLQSFPGSAALFILPDGARRTAGAWPMVNG